MSNWVHALESRQLFTASATVLASDVASANANVAALNVAVAKYKASEKSLQAALAANLKSSQPKSSIASNRKLLATLTSTSNRQTAIITKDASSLATNVKTLFKRDLADVKLLLAHPTKATYQAKVTKDIATLNSTVHAKQSALLAALTNAIPSIVTGFTAIGTANPAVAATVTADELTLVGELDAAGSASAAIETATAKLASDLGNQPVTTNVTLDGLTFFRGDSNGNNISASGSILTRGVWTTGVGVQNVPGNYAAVFFISKVPNPTAGDFLTPAALSLALTTGDNKFYFWADSDDTAGGSQTFGLNVFLNSSAGTTPTLSGYTIPGTGQTLVADSAAVTSSINLIVEPGAGTLSTSAGSSGTVTLSAFQVLGVAGAGSTVDLINSTNTSAFTPPPHPDGIFDTYGTFTLTVTA